MDASMIRSTAAAWSDETHAARDEAAAKMEATRAFSAAQIAFALNEQMGALATFTFAGDEARRGRTLELASDDAQPLCGLPEALALAAHGWEVELPDEARYELTRAFLRAAGAIRAGAQNRPGGVLRAFDADAPREALYPLAIAVLDGKENEATREDLAEDLLLYDGASARCTRLVFAPRGLSPDPYLATCAEWRGRFPASDRLRASVRMMSAFARKAGLPRAELDDSSLLVTRGAPEVQRPGHVRWVEYDDLAEIATFCAGQPCRVFSRRGYTPAEVVQQIGRAHRPGAARFAGALEAVAAWRASHTE